MSGVFAVSFLFRALVNICIAVVPDRITEMQCKAIVNKAPGWPILVFSLQFFGETVPLMILFYIQDRNSRPRRKTIKAQKQPHLEVDQTQSTNARTASKQF